MPALMHISDLHRSRGDPVSNAELVAAIERDLHRQSRESPAISPPDALVVSGDLVRGANLGDPNSDDIISSQYQEVEQFLVELTDLLLDGDRSRVAVCPGNHDVNWCSARAAMEEVPKDQFPSEIDKELWTPSSRYRWDWHECKLYRVVDWDLYADRMREYWNFIERFYDNTNILQLPSHGREPLLIELFDRRVLVAALNSCEGNDCFRHTSEINPEALARMHLELTRDEWKYPLQIAVWHHNTAGPPSADDYLRVEQVYALIEYGFSLGLHGHQHRSTVVSHEIRLPEYGNLAIFGTGSLAAGIRDRPRGTNRQYSIVELSHDLTTAKFHLREIESGLQFGPRYLNAFGGQSYTEVDLRLSSTNASSHNLNWNALVNEAEEASKAGDDMHALELLLTIVDHLDAYGRELLAETAMRLERWDIILDHLTPPSNIRELTTIVKAAVGARDFESARSAVEAVGDMLDLPRPQRDELLEWIAGEEIIR